MLQMTLLRMDGACQACLRGSSCGRVACVDVQQLTTGITQFVGGRKAQ